MLQDVLVTAGNMVITFTWDCCSGILFGKFRAKVMYIYHISWFSGVTAAVMLGVTCTSQLILIWSLIYRCLNVRSHDLCLTPNQQ